MRNVRRSLRFLLHLISSLLVLSRFAAGAADRLEEIRKRGELSWGTDAEGGAPYVYIDPEHPDRMMGFEYELAEALAARLGVKAKMVQNQWDQLMPALDRGNFDIILNGLEITPEHLQQVAISQPYYVYAQQIVTRADEQGISKIDDLHGKAVGVLSGSVAASLLKEVKDTDARD